MDKTAYNLGVDLALRDAGLVKESGLVWEGVKRALRRGVWDPVRSYVTALPLRDALAGYGRATIGNLGTAAAKLRREALPYLVPLGLGAAGLGGYYGAKKLFPKAFGD